MCGFEVFPQREGNALQLPLCLDEVIWYLMIDTEAGLLTWSSFGQTFENRGLLSITETNPEEFDIPS